MCTKCSSSSSECFIPAMDKLLVALAVALCVALVAVRDGDGASLAASLPKTLEEHLERLARSVSPSDTNAAAAAASTAAGEMGEQKVCHSTTPCGWAVYVPFTRRVDYFMKNTCECPKDRECLRTDDDLSVSAYVYRCRAADKQDKQSES